MLLLTLVAPIAVFVLLLALQWYEQRWLGAEPTPGRTASPAEPRQPPGPR